MDECTKFFNHIKDLKLGCLEDEVQTELFAHLAICRECRELAQFHDELASAAHEFAEVDNETLAAMRGRVLDEIRSARPIPVTAARPTVFSGFGGTGFLAAAAAVVLVVGGIAVGRWLGAPELSDNALLVTTLEESAQDNSRLRDVEDSPNIISNVAVRSVGEGRVAMSFDVARHLEIERPLHDPLVNEVLVHAILDQSSMGSRLKAVSMAASARDGKIDEALTFSMLNDPELPVRMRALEILAERPVSDRVERGLMEVLQHDESMQMRLLAIEVLATGGPNTQRVLEDFRGTEEAVEPAIAERLASFTQS